MSRLNLGESLRAEVQALTYPLRRRARHRAGALANDLLVTLGREPRFDETLAEQWSRILASSKPILSGMPAARGPKVLFGAMFGGGINRIMDSTIAMALRLRGASPVVLACDQGLPACEVNPFGNFQPPPGDFAPHRFSRGRLYGCQACTVKLAESHSGLPLPQLSLARYVRPEDLRAGEKLARDVSIADLRSVVHREIRVGEHAYSTLLKATFRGDPPEDELTLFMARRYLASAVALVEAGERVFDEVRPDHLVVPDGVYLTAGTLVAIARKRGLHVVVHGAPFRKGTIWLYHGDSYFRAFTTERTDHWSSLEMTEERRRVADEYLAAKHFATRDYVSYHVDSIQDEDAIRREVGLDSRPIVSVYTNVLWDAQLYYSFSVFRGMLDWLFETIEYYATRPDVQLVIRVHPGEARGAWPTNQPLVPEIERRFPKLPDNVKLVLPESTVSSYVLGKMSGLALVYGARVGMELVMLGTPVVVAGESLIRGRGFTIDPESREAYFDLLSKSAAFPEPSSEVQERARKWYYYYLFRMMMPFPFFYGDPAGKSGKFGLSFDSLDALLPGRSPVLDRVCQGILDGVTPFEWDEFEGQG